ncbi:hypothetical protein CEXT_134831 [Caerostris extrusa]|uniref:LAGLIDADG homing endonuclease n=1 Tax=Caerostris extrusa TaxID=172846 RepID=A0AAV4X9D7_CAEEX|nr:hypothetical protein CEXT_134831 [Caerostris extrusa]
MGQSPLYDTLKMYSGTHGSYKNGCFNFNPFSKSQNDQSPLYDTLKAVFACVLAYKNGCFNFSPLFSKWSIFLHDTLKICGTLGSPAFKWVLQFQYLVLKMINLL